MFKHIDSTVLGDMIFSESRKQLWQLIFHETFNLSVHDLFTCETIHWQGFRFPPPVIFFSFLLSLVKLSFFLNIRLNSATFKWSGKQPFLKVKLIIFVRIKAWLSFVHFNIPAEISPTGVDFVPSNLKISRRNSSSLT